VLLRIFCVSLTLLFRTVALRQTDLPRTESYSLSQRDVGSLCNYGLAVLISDVSVGAYNVIYSRGVFVPWKTALSC